MRYQFPAQNLNVSAGSLSSMIDIIFLLIIFFVVTASIDREQLQSHTARRRFGRSQIAAAAAAGAQHLCRRDCPRRFP